MEEREINGAVGCGGCVLAVFVYRIWMWSAGLVEVRREWKVEVQDR